MNPQVILAALAKAPEATGTVHDYSRGNVWGRAAYTNSRDDDGLTLRGWLFGAFPSPEPGDWLLLPNGAKSTRYRITTVRWARDPDDMWHFTATFDPRSAP